MKKQNPLYFAFILLAVISMSVSTSYANNDKDHKTPSQLKKLNYDFDRIARAVAELLQLERISDPTRIKYIIDFLKQYPSEDVASAMIVTLNNFAIELNKAEPRIKMTDKQYQSYRMILHATENMIDKNLKPMYDVTLSNLSPFVSTSERQRLANKQDEVGIKINKNKTLRTLNDIKLNPFEVEEQMHLNEKLLLLENLKQSDPNKPATEQVQKNLYVQERQELQKKLEKEIIGQPELVQALVNLRIESLMNSGQTIGSPIHSILGSRQSGKLTSIYAYVKALHPNKANAIEKHLLVLNEPVRSHDSYWKLIGSSNGYQGADEITPFVRFLVDHSSGRYQIVEEKTQQGVKSRIIEDPNWNPDNIDPSAARPEDAVIYIPNFQNWSAEYKDRVVKQFAKTGDFELQKNANGLFKIHGPIPIIVSSNEGQFILSTRNTEGQRRGYAYTEEQVMNRWSSAHKDEEQLKNAIRTTAQRASPNNARDGGSFGTSEDLLGLFTSKITLLRPLPEKDLKELAQLKIHHLNQKLQKLKVSTKIELKGDDQFLTELTRYKLDPEASAAAISTNVEYLVEKPLLQFLSTTEQLYGYNGTLLADLRLIENENGTKSLKITISNADYKGPREFTLAIQSTQVDKYPTKLSKERIQFWAGVSKKIQEKVFGIPKSVADRIANSFMLAEDRGLSTLPNEQKREGALIIALLGLSSTGKSELTAILSEAVLGHRAARFVIDFNQVKTLQDLKEKILGIRDSNGQCKPSDFIEMYTRSNGNLMVAFEEMANAPKELLKAAYDILREPIVTTFCDNVPRSMKQVKILVMGNVGEEIFQNIPSTMSEPLRALMWQQFYQYFINNKLAQRQILESYFSKALINRVGDENIHFMAPLSFKSRWELIQRKILDNLQVLNSDKGRYGWNVKFDTNQDLQSFLEIADEEGFVLEEQGASIDRFIKNTFDRDLRSALMHAQISHSQLGDGKTILLKIDKEAHLDKDHEGEQKTFTLKVLSEDKTEFIDVAITGRKASRIPSQKQDEVLKVAIHEVGHLVSTLYASNTRRPTYVTILPGVLNDAKNLMMYDGLAVSEETSKFSPTKADILKTLAIALGGYVAEKTFFAAHSTGVSDDFQRATQIAQNVILVTGFSAKWGIKSIPKGMSITEYMANLSEVQKMGLDIAVKELLYEAEELSQNAINQAIEDGTFQKFTALLAKKGHLNETDIQAVAAMKSEPKKSWYVQIAGFFKKTPQTDTILTELKKGEIVIVESLVENEIRDQRSKAIKFDMPIAHQHPCEAALR